MKLSVKKKEIIPLLGQRKHGPTKEEEASLDRSSSKMNLSICLKASRALPAFSSVA